MIEEATAPETSSGTTVELRSYVLRSMLRRRSCLLTAQVKPLVLYSCATSRLNAESLGALYLHCKRPRVAFCPSSVIYAGV